MGVDSPPYHATAINIPQDRDQASVIRTETAKPKDSGDAPHVLQDLPRNCRLFFMVEHALVRETS